MVTTDREEAVTPNPFSSDLLENALLAFERTETANVGNHERHPELVLVAGDDREAAVLDAEAAAVGVVGDLRGRKLHDAFVEIVERAKGGIPTPALLVADSKDAAKLIEGGRELPGIPHLVLSDGDEVLAEPRVTREATAGDPAAERIVVGTPLDAKAGNGTDPHG